MIVVLAWPLLAPLLVTVHPLLGLVLALMVTDAGDINHLLSLEESSTVIVALGVTMLPNWSTASTWPVMLVPADAVKFVQDLATPPTVQLTKMSLEYEPAEAEVAPLAVAELELTH